MCHGDQDPIGLTHVCRAWKEIFASHSPLWTHFDCVGKSKTRLYLERSKSSPINLSLVRVPPSRFRDSLPPCDPFFQIVPHAIERLKSLSVKAIPRIVQTVITSLSRPAPLLEEIMIAVCREYKPGGDPVLASPLFDGALPLLRKLHLESVRTELPWRDMINLTSFKLVHTSVSIGQLLDFFQSAPSLREVELLSATPTSGVQNQQLVSLGCLERMVIEGDEPPHLLLDHLLIPLGASLTTQATFLTSIIEDLLPRSLGNLKNLSDFTTVLLSADEDLRMEFIGPNGKLSMVSIDPEGDPTSLMFEALAHFDTSKTKRLKIHCGSSPFNGPLHRALLPMENLRSLTLSQCKLPHLLIDALRPRTVNLLETIVCPGLEELCIDGEVFDIRYLIEVAAARAEMGSQLNSVKVATWHGFRHTAADALELRKHVLHVEC